MDWFRYVFIAPIHIFTVGNNVINDMALDFHKLNNREYLFGLDDSRFKNLNEIFIEYKNWTGTIIDLYNDTKLTIEGQKTLIKIIDIYIEKSNLNSDKQKTTDILEFRALINYFSNKKYDIEILGD
ncbi:hypothetical protein [Aquimarina algicola]|uniref:Uncharacterized protein n=1 Tax=Aquimarina algicola TaxID=2589995 RepID=A0A504JGL6_9FLAO|nr:hypothetical protein [Aquimarina algicola]TPN86813.1 hypothetical protein FHK87_04200 [Aquimarina algicola]